VFAKVEDVVAVWTTIHSLYGQHKAINEAVERLRARETSSAPFYAARLDKLSAALAEKTAQALRHQQILEAVSSTIASRTSHRRLTDEVEQLEKRLASLASDQQELTRLIDMEQNSATCPKCGEVFVPQRTEQSPAALTQLTTKGANSHANSHARP
jgi:DNA repair exonuclease SbcCD ATPase subunit